MPFEVYLPGSCRESPSGWRPVIDSDRSVGVTDIIIRYAQGISYVPLIGTNVWPFTITGCTSKLSSLPFDEHVHAAVALLLVNLPQLVKSPVRLLELDEICFRISSALLQLLLLTAARISWFNWAIWALLLLVSVVVEPLRYNAAEVVSAPA